MILPEPLRNVLDTTEPMRATELTALSDLPPAELHGREQAWLAASPERRHGLLAALRSLAEDNVELNFKTIYLLGLDDPSPEVRRAAIEGLWEDEGSAMLERLQRMLFSDPDPGVRSAAATALGRFAFLAAAGNLPSTRADQLQEGVRRALVDVTDGSEVQRRLVEALSYFHDDSLVHEFIGRLYREGDEAEQESAVLAMGRSMDLRWRDVVVRELENEDAGIRFQAARAAGEMQLAETVPELRTLADEADPEVRAAAIWALGQIGSKPATDKLRLLAQAEAEDVREAAEEALGEAMYAGGYEA
ncbi:MAG: HEAT repeat domain-containing protein [Chloroflexota bacterium]|nr:HEAT repeat domain-containing protein [Chloroflexota bacterium]